MQKKVLITLKESEIGKVQTRFFQRFHNLEVIELMDDLGIISACIEESELPRLAEDAAVESVETEQQVHIPPPDAQVQ